MLLIAYFKNVQYGIIWILIYNEKYVCLRSIFWNKLDLETVSGMIWHPVFHKSCINMSGKNPLHGVHFIPRDRTNNGVVPLTTSRKYLFTECSMKNG